MEEKLRSDILQALHDKSYAFEFNDLKRELEGRFGHERVVEGHLDVFSSRVMHILEVLNGEGLVQKQTGQTGNLRMSTFYSLTGKGYELFRPRHKKALDYFRRNVETVVVSTVVTTVVSVAMALILKRVGL